MIDFLFPFYMCLNCFVAGTFYQHTFIDDEDPKVVGDWIFLFALIFFGTFVLIGIILYALYEKHLKQ